MIAVSNTTPLRYLTAIAQENLLSRLFDRVMIPGAVHRELTDKSAPEVVRRFALSLPAWLEVKAVSPSDLSSIPFGLHRGEREAISLTEIVKPDVLLMDERAGRSIAISRNLPVSGTLGVLERADELDLIKDFGDILIQLTASGFFLDADLQKQLLNRHLTRKGQR